MDEVLRGNFKVKNPVDLTKNADESEKETLSQIVKKKVLASLGGSMVYVERNQLNWDGDE